jgi:hypothetical protein
VTRKPPPCTFQKVSPHSLTYARLYPSGWWCDRHSPRRRKGLPDLPPSPGWPIHRQPPHGEPTDDRCPTSAEH